MKPKRGLNDNESSAANPLVNKLRIGDFVFRSSVIRDTFHPPHPKRTPQLSCTIMCVSIKLAHTGHT